METITLAIPQKTIHYPIFIGRDLIGKIGELIDMNQRSSVGVITDKTISELWLPRLRSGVGCEMKVTIVPSGENAKTVESVLQILDALQTARFDRSSLLITMGGGAIGDAAGFAASVYMRGLSYVYVPTTLLSQADASIGGKTGIDFGGVKNSVGAIHQPIAVVTDVETLATLPDSELISGFAEVIKHGIIADAEYLALVTSKKPREFSCDELITVIKGSCEIKRSVVEKDEREKGARRLLNFGHTIGHAIEALSLETDTPLLHGEAIAIGMVEEARISERVGLLQKGGAALVAEMLEKVELPTAMPKFPRERIMEKIESDKKSAGGKVGWTLLKRIGEAVAGVEVENLVKKPSIHICQTFSS